MLRSHFESKLQELHAKIIEMGDCVEKAIADAISAFSNNDLELCDKIIENDQVIDDMEKIIESECLWLIAREQPVASDLRMITAALKMTTDMERIADHASDIAELVMRIEDENSFSDSIHIPQMATEAIKMVNNAVSAYVNNDLALADTTIRQDDKVDNYFNVIKNEIAKDLRERPSNIDNAIDYLLIAKYLERIGDHAVNICEWVRFSQTGEHKNKRIF